MKNIKAFITFFIATMSVELLLIFVIAPLKIASPLTVVLLNSALLTVSLFFVGYFIMKQQLTMLTKEREFLTSMHARNSLVIESIGESIIAMDVGGNIVSVNKAAEQTLGCDKLTLIGKHSHELFHYARPDGSAYRQEESNIYAPLRDGKVRRISDEVFWKKDGTAVPVAYIASPFIECMQITGVVVSFHPIIERANPRRATTNIQTGRLPRLSADS